MTENAFEAFVLNAPLLNLQADEILPLLGQLLPSIGLGIVVGMSLAFGRKTLFQQLRTILEKTHTPTGLIQWGFHMLDALKGWFIWAMALYLAIRTAPPAEPLHDAADYLFTMLFLFQLGIALVKALRQGCKAYAKAHPGDGGRATLANGMMLVFQIIIWVTILLMAMSASGINVTALLAGLGVGGVVIALAFKKIAEDIFSSLSIVTDKPFVLGDYIESGPFAGHVEHIGLKTTRLRALAGELIVISNSDLLASRIRNYGPQAQKRHVMAFNVPYDTAPAVVANIPALVEQAIAAHDGATFERCHMVKYGEASLAFEAVCHIPAPTYAAFLDGAQAIQLDVMRRFAKKGIAFAYPTQVLHIRPDAHTNTK